VPQKLKLIICLFIAGHAKAGLLGNANPKAILLVKTGTFYGIGGSVHNVTPLRYTLLANLKEDG